MIKKNILIGAQFVALLGSWAFFLWNNNKRELPNIQQQEQISKVTDEKGQLQQNFDEALARLDSLTGANNKLAHVADSERETSASLQHELKYRALFNKQYLNDQPVDYSVLKNLNLLTRCPNKASAKPSLGQVRVTATAKADAEVQVTEFFCGVTEYCHSTNCGFVAADDDHKTWSWVENVPLDAGDSTLPFKVYLYNSDKESNTATFTMRITDPQGKVLASFPDKDEADKSKIVFSSYRIKALGGVLHLHK